MGRRWRCCSKPVLNHEKGIVVLNVKITRGFTLIELMITLAVLALLLSLGVPTFSKIIHNAQVRSVAEALQNGLRLAQNEAVRHSHQTAFVLTNDPPGLNATAIANGKNWSIQIVPRPGETAEYVQGGSFGNQAGAVTITSETYVLCFNPIGRPVTIASTGLGPCTASMVGIPTTFVVANAGADRSLQLQVSAGGKIRMCDASVPLSTRRPDDCSS